MSLITKSRSSVSGSSAPSAAVVAQGLTKTMQRDADANRKRARTLAKQQQAAERVAAATGELAAGINEASSAAEELKRAGENIATGAEEAAGAAQQSLTALSRTAGAIRKQLEGATASRSKAEATQLLAAKVNAEVSTAIDNVGNAAERQAGSVRMVGELERQASNIGDIVKAVARIADQTNLLALNAAIEAARAGQHGKGFAVVADEVRTLAETSERSARQIQELVGQIQTEVKVIAEGINESARNMKGEAEKGAVILKQMEQIRSDSVEIVAGANEIATAAAQSDIAAQQALKGSEQIAAAATEQSQACEEATKSVQEQAGALSECEQTAQNLSDIAEDLKNSTDIAKSAEEVASAAEELSKGVAEINRSAGQILVALEQIRKGAQTQAAATNESAAAVTQIEQGAQITEQRAGNARDRSAAIRVLLGNNKEHVERLVAGLSSGAEATRKSGQQVKELELVSRKIDKIVDAISQVSVQTNMLAVNGSIEAARAGDFGKGFVVVATDIRNLAHDSAENADRIKDMVKAIQDQIALVGRDLGEIITSAISEVEKSRSITGNLLTMEADIDAIEKGNLEAVAASQDIVTALAQVKTGVSQISAAATEAEKAAEQAAASARQQSQSAEELSAAIEEIASLADELQSAS
jgi:methyl-accepting chemotaxis protein